MNDFTETSEAISQKHAHMKFLSEIDKDKFPKLKKMQIDGVTPDPAGSGRYIVVSELRFTPGVGNHLGQC